MSDWKPENTHIRRGTSTRVCRACSRAAVRRYRERQVTP